MWDFDQSPLRASVACEDGDVAGSWSLIYALRSGPYVKIGVTNNVVKRMKSLQCANPHEILCIASDEIPHSMRSDIEARAHQALKAHHVRGEWFEIADNGAIEALLEDLAQMAVDQIEDGAYHDAIAPPHAQR